VRHARVVTVALLALAAARPASAAAARPEDQMIDAINRARASHGGLRPLHPAPGLRRVALRYSHWLIDHNVFAHSQAGAREKRSRQTGEALAMHFSTKPGVGATIRSWLRSPPHRALVLTRSMNVAGVGHASGRYRGRRATIWVLELARG
jgi:uncharacterized protein YkwD